LKIKVETGIIKDAKKAEEIKALSSLDGCPFHYCDSNPVCKEKCRHA